MTRLTTSFCFLILFCLHSLGYVTIPGINDLENKAYDLKVNLTKPDLKDPRVVILDIDEKSLKQIGRWPWNRLVMSQLVSTLFDHYYIQTLGFDILFAEPDNSSGLPILQLLAQNNLKDDPGFQQFFTDYATSLDYDGQFSSALENRDIVMGYFFRNKTSTNDADFNIGKLPAPIELANEIGPNISLITATGYGANLELFQNSALDAGFIDNPSISADGIIRKVPLVQYYQGKVYQSLSLAMVRALYGFPPVKLEFTPGNQLIGLSLDEKFIPTTPHGEVYVPFRGNFPSFSYISAADVIDKKVNPAILDGAVVIMGTTATGLLDMRATPVGNVYPGVEIHANVISGILDQTIKHEPFDLQGLDFLLHLIIGLILIFALPRFKVFSGIALSTLFASGVIWLNFYFWTTLQVIMPVVSLLLFIISFLVLHLAYGYFVEDRNKRALAGLFGQYVPPELVDEMSQKNAVVSLEGETRELTILFSDIRSFTSLSEKLEPKQLTKLMNQYLTVMTQIILKNRGTIDKYIGDAIMAFWGAPLADDEHANHAMQAAIEMRDAIPALNEKFKQQGFPEISIGIGLNTGKVNVGNMGSEFRMAYTVLGDEVNLASRLESITKQYKVNLIVSENTKNKAPNWIYQELDLVKVVGKNIPISIYYPIAKNSEISEVQQQEMYLFKVAVKLYRQQKWAEAKNILNDLCAKTNEAFLYKLYLSRILAFESSPPGEQWDGVYEAKSK